MAILGGSPLGLINVRSNPNPSGRSTFNDGNTRNVNVLKYNAGDYNASMRGNSLFSGDRVVRAWPGIDAYSSALPGVDAVNYNALKGGTSSQTPQGSFKQRKTLHNNDVYDTSVLNIIEHLAGTLGALKMADFAYLKDIGVFPNNRLMIARRFASPIGDNIIKPKKKNAKGGYSEYGPLATLISWLPQDSDFLNISFGEKWTDAEADFKELFNRIGGDLMTKGTSTAGASFGEAVSAIPLPGFTEIFQRKFLEKIGFLGKGASDTIPSGNPNLIKEAKRRTVIGYESAGSGLTCTVEVEFSAEYELKFISGIDPTIVWMDILGMILRFGTSPSDTYGLSEDLSARFEKWLNNPTFLITDVVESIKGAMILVRDGLQQELDTLKGKMQYNKSQELVNGKDGKKDGEVDIDNVIKGIGERTGKFLDKIGEIVKDVLIGLVRKYRIEIAGIVNALSGLPSTPWHITVGNPLRPVFCAGDMYTTDVKLILGPTLAFNDLPSSIKVSFKLSNARPWGLQEIMAKFNSGYLRTVDVQKSFYETNKGEQPGLFPFETEPVADAGTASNIGGAQQPAIPGSTQSLPTSITSPTLGVGNTQSSLNTGSTTKSQNGKMPKK